MKKWHHVKWRQLLSLCFPPHSSTTGANTPGGPSKETLSCLLLAEADLPWNLLHAGKCRQIWRQMHAYIFWYKILCSHTWSPYPHFRRNTNMHAYTHWSLSYRLSVTIKKISAETESQRGSTTTEQTWFLTWVTGKDLHAPSLTCSLRDSGSIGVQQYWTWARKTQEAAEHVFCCCPWEQRGRERRRVKLLTPKSVQKSPLQLESHLEGTFVFFSKHLRYPGTGVDSYSVIITYKLFRL